jgi:predicted HicB family RNase H-like nuclease
MMEHNGFWADVQFDDAAGLFHGEVINMRDVVTFQGRTVAELRKAFRESLEDYVEFCAQRGEEPEKPFSGKFVVRLSPELHREITIAARRRGRSVNAWVSEHLAQSAAREQG